MPFISLTANREKELPDLLEEDYAALRSFTRNYIIILMMKLFKERHCEELRSSDEAIS